MSARERLARLLGVPATRVTMEITPRGAIFKWRQPEVTAETSVVHPDAVDMVSIGPLDTRTVSGSPGIGRINAFLDEIQAQGGLDIRPFTGHGYTTRNLTTREILASFVTKWRVRFRNARAALGGDFGD